MLKVRNHSKLKFYILYENLKNSCIHQYLFWMLIYLFNLFEKLKARVSVRAREIFQLLIYSLSACNIQDCIWLKSGSRNSIWISTIGVRPCYLRHRLLPLRMHISRKLECGAGRVVWQANPPPVMGAGSYPGCFTFHPSLCLGSSRG